MKPLSYARPANADDALQLARDPDSRYLAGGTNLVDLLKLGVEQPTRLVDLRALPYDDVELRDGTLQIGANVGNAALAAHPDVRAKFPVLSQALLSGASGQLRNMATVGGNLLQRTRCMYFMDATKPCNKREPGSGCPARTGEHSNLAVLGASEHCIATHPSDMAVALAALDAVVHVRTADGTSAIPLADFYVSPGADPSRETVLPRGALITAVEVPRLPFARTSRYRKVRERASYAFAIASVAAALDLDEEGTVRDVRLAFGAVAPMPWRARAAEDALRGERLDEDAVRSALRAEFATAQPLPDNAYKIDLCTSVAVQVLLELAEGAR